MDKLEAQKEETLNNVIYQDAFEWRFEFPEVLNDEGTYIGFDVIIFYLNLIKHHEWNIQMKFQGVHLNEITSLNSQTDFYR